MSAPSPKQQPLLRKRFMPAVDGETLVRLAFLVGVLTALAAGAYVLPGGSILRRMADGRDELQLSTIRVEGSYVFSGPAVKEAATALGLSTERSEVIADGLLLLKLPERCRFEVTVPEGNKLAVVQVERSRRVEGPELPALSVAMGQLCPLLAVRAASESESSRDRVEQHLQSLGIATRTTSLARFGGEVAYVLGEQDESKPQFWVYKDAFRPARVRWKDKAGAWDVRFIDYASPATGEWLPRSIEVWKEGQRVMRFTATRADTRAPIADKLFAPAPAGRPAP